MVALLPESHCKLIYAVFPTIDIVTSAYTVEALGTIVMLLLFVAAKA